METRDFIEGNMLGPAHHAGIPSLQGHNRPLTNNNKPTTKPRASAHLAAGVCLLPSGGVFKSAAVEVLRREQRLMTTGEICKLAVEWGVLQCSGKTPEATMASSLYSDIKKKDGPSIFIRPREGLFGLREWVEQGLVALDEAESVVQPVQSGKKRSASRGEEISKNSRHKAAPVNAPLALNSGSLPQFLGNAGAPEENGGQQRPNTGQNCTGATTPVQTFHQQGQQLYRPRLTSESNEVFMPPQQYLKYATNQVYPQNNTSTAVFRENFVQILSKLEKKVMAVEERFGALHPQAGRAHLLLYQACMQQQHLKSDPEVNHMAVNALKRAYDVMVFNKHIELLVKGQK